MMANLEQIRIEGLRFQVQSRQARDGSTVKGHYRTYGDHKVWVEEHLRNAHTVVRRITK